MITFLYQHRKDSTMNILEKAVHEFEQKAKELKASLTAQDTTKAKECLRTAEHIFDETGSVVLELQDWKMMSLSRIIPELTKLVEEGNFSKAQELLRQVSDALSGKLK